MPQAPSTDCPTNGHHSFDAYDADGCCPGDKSPTTYEPPAQPQVERAGSKDSEAAKSDSSSIEEDANSSDSGYKPKTPSTAERRRLFEVKVG